MTAAPVQLLHHALDLDVDLDERLLQAHSDFCIVVRRARHGSYGVPAGYFHAHAPSAPGSSTDRSQLSPNDGATSRWPMHVKARRLAERDAKAGAWRERQRLDSHA